MRLKKVISLAIVICLMTNLVACSMEEAKQTAGSTWNEIGKKAETAKETVVDWWSNIDFSKFKQGWDYSVEFLGTNYNAIMSSQYVESIENAITTLKTDINSVAGSMRGTAQEAGYLAEKWASDTFNINAKANGSEYSAEVVGSNEFGSVDVATNYGENASLKYYKTAQGSAEAQAKTLLEAYKEYQSKAKDPISLKDYMDKNGYDSSTQEDLLASVYEGQTRIIPTDQLSEAKAFLQGRIDKLSSIDGDVASARTKSYQETLNSLKDRLKAPDGTESKPLSSNEAKAIAELAQEGEFDPEDFGIKVSSVISPKYVFKQAMGTGLEVAALKTILTIGPDIFSILKEAISTGNIDESMLKETGLEGAIAAAEGFTEGSVCRVVTTMCSSGALGEGLKEANPSVVATLTVIVIEAAIRGYDLSQGKITPEEYGNMMVDRLMVGLLAVPTSALFLAILPATHIAMLAGGMAGCMVASIGYLAGKEVVLDFIDGGGFEAIVPVEVAKTFSVAKDKLASLDIKEKVSTFKDSVVSVANDGYIKVVSLLPGN